MKNELISVIMSIYNEEIKWIKEAVESILNQTYHNIQLIIVVDNLSIDDNIRKYLEQVNDDDYRIIIIYNKSNMGLAKSLNRAIKRADGVYIARMDADDVSELVRLEVEYNTINELGVDLVGTGRLLIDEDGGQISNYEPPITDNELIKRILPFGSCFVHPTIMIRSSVIRKINGYRHFRQSQDYDLWLRMLSSGCTFANIDIPLLKYRIRQNGITQKKPYLQYMTARYQKKLYWMRKRTGTDTYTEQNFSRYLEKHNASSEKKNKRYAYALQQLNTGIGLLRSNFILGLCKIVNAIALFPSLIRLLVEKIKIVYYMKKYANID